MGHAADYGIRACICSALRQPDGAMHAFFAYIGDDRAAFARMRRGETQELQFFL